MNLTKDSLFMPEDISQNKTDVQFTVAKLEAKLVLPIQIRLQVFGSYEIKSCSDVLNLTVDFLLLHSMQLFIYYLSNNGVILL